MNSGVSLNADLSQSTNTCWRAFFTVAGPALFWARDNALPLLLHFAGIATQPETKTAAELIMVDKGGGGGVIIPTPSSPPPSHSVRGRVWQKRRSR